jgi:hypothetical protein
MRHTRRMARDDRGRDWSDATTSQGVLKIVDRHQMLGRGKEGFSQGLHRPCPCQHPGELLASGTIEHALFKICLPKRSIIKNIK